MTAEPKMTAEAATTFAGFSQGNALALTMAAKSKGCQCVPYEDWFTYNRWLAQGFQVQKGEHGVRLTVFISATEEGKDGQPHSKTFPKGTSVFCRCQVRPVGAH